ncbi:MAG: efflux RND transporter permease subunit [Phycisphaerales bacterium]|nr:MAG: efflux RND transporter permease subunit [Phycisphaerales bacterium]
MGLIRFAIENPVKVTVGVILLVLFGGLSLLRVPIQLTPDVDKPVITVSTFWSGASPQEIESEIVDRQEEKLKNVTNLEKMTSSSSESAALVKLEFPVGVDKDIAYRDVSDKLRQVTGYPEEVDEPIISATDDDMANTIAWMILYSEEGKDIAHLKTFVEDQIKPQLERAEGISSVPVYGGLDREIQIEVDAHLLAARKLTYRDVERALRRQNRNISAGTITQGKRDYTYRTVGEYRSVKEIEDTVVAYRDGGPILVRDVANVIDGLKKQYAFVRSMGQFVIAMPAKRETGANVIKAMKNLQDRIALVNREILEPRGLNITLTQVYDETTYIWSAVWLVVKNLFFGGFLAICVLLLFLRSGSATGIIALAIPVSVVGTFLIIRMLDRTLNVIMLAGMAFAVGMVVDNAIVVLENIFRHRSMGKPRSEAAFDGAREVWGAVLASTLTTVAVFLPVIFIQEEAGQLFKDIAIAISSAVGLSLIVSVLVIPPLASRFFGASQATEQKGKETWFLARKISALVAAINRGVGRRIAVVCGLSGLAILGSWALTPATEYLPAGNQNLVFGLLFSPPGYSVDEFKRMALIVEEGDPADPNDGVRPFWEAKLGTPRAASLPAVDIPIGKDGSTIRTVTPPPVGNFFFVSFSGAAFMGCISQEPTNVKPLEFVMTRAGQRIPGVFSFFTQTSLFRGGGGTGNSVDVEIRGDDLDAVITSANAIMDSMMAAGYDYPSPNPANFALGRPEIQLVPDRAKAADLGLDVNDVGFTVEACVDGAFVGEYNDHGKKIDMVIKVAGTENSTVEEMGRIPIYTPSGHVVPIASAVRLNRTTAPQQINHIEEMGSVTLSAKSKTGVPLQETMRELEEEVIGPLRESGAIHPSVITALAGTADKLTKTQHALIGDFRDVVRHPRILGMSVSSSIAVLIVAAAAIALAARLVLGARAGLIAVITATVVLVGGCLLANPSLILVLAESRAMLALVITYLLMAALFESFAYPFVIMFSVPLATVGGFAALRVVHQVSLYDVSSPIQQLDVLTMLGFVILVGIVVNNAILIVHQALTYIRRDDMEPSSAVALSVQTRTRPIFMSATTSILGMCPLVVMPGAGSELYRGLGSVVLGGLLVSTIFTLVVVPAMFTLFLDLQTWVRAVLWSRQPSKPSEAVASAIPVAQSPEV